MQGIDLKNPEERKKLIWAIGLGIVALIFLWWAFFGFGGSSRPAPRVANSNQPAARPQSTISQPQKAEELRTPVDQLVPVIYSSNLPVVAEAGRNIFAYYEKPLPPAPSTPTPTPTPTPPVLLASVSPSTVYARTDDFKMEVTGDKFTPETRVTIDGQELSTKFVGMQQLSANVPASLIANPGTRQVVVRSPDGRLYSNAVALNISQPPVPNFTYIGIIRITRGMLDVAMLQDKSNREVVKAQRGDVLGGRFRITTISEKELVVVDTSLKIKHTIPFTSGERGIGPSSRPTPRVDSEDDEP